MQAKQRAADQKLAETITRITQLATTGKDTAALATEALNLSVENLKRTSLIFTQLEKFWIMLAEKWGNLNSQSNKIKRMGSDCDLFIEELKIIFFRWMSLSKINIVAEKRISVASKEITAILSTDFKPGDLKAIKEFAERCKVSHQRARLTFDE